MNKIKVLRALSGAFWIWGFLPDDDFPATYVHRCFQHEVWRRSGALDRMGAVAGLLFWPLVVPALVGFATWRAGALTKERTGKAMLRQMREQLILAAGWAVLPPWYYIFELHDDDKRVKVGRYLHRFETKGGIYSLLRRGQRGKDRRPSALGDKALFAARCRDSDIPAVPVAMVLEVGRITQADGDATLTLPEMNLFVKPRYGKGGRGVERWEFQGGRNSDYRSRDGRRLNAQELLEHLKALSIKESCLVQPCVVNHSAIADLTTGALATVRILTCRDERGGFEATHAVFRMPRGRDSIVDNFHAGGIAAKVDLGSGELGRATDLGFSAETGWHERHPDTGALILGRRLPRWREHLELAHRAHAAFPEHVVAGWDMALLPEGLRIVEGNSSPDVDLIQRPHGTPLGDSRFGELLAFHLGQALRPSGRSGSNEARASLWQ